MLDFVTRGGERAPRLPRVQPGRRARTGVYRGTEPAGRAAAPAVDRHHRERGGDEGAVPPGPHARHGRGELRRPAPAGRPLHLRRPHAGVRARARTWWRTCGRRRARASIVPHWSGRAACRSRRARRRRSAIKLDEARQGVFVGPEMAAVRPILELQARWSRLPGRRRAADRAGRDPRRPSPLLLSGRGPAGARRPGRPRSPTGWPSSARSPSPSRPTTTASSCCRRPRRRSTRRSRPDCSRPRICCTTSPRASTRPSWRGGSSARSRGWRG